ncbi:MAG TPA: copper-containing nitrite reductase [Chloroflexota bacterium]|jgi:nitrite reductase (NO-forming)
MASHAETGARLRALIPFWPAVPVLGIAIVLAGLYVGAPRVAAPPTVEHAHTSVSAAAAAGRLALPDVAAPPLTAEEAVVPVQIDMKETVATLDDGVEYRFWTFGGTVPGPMIRVRRGDTVELTVRNAADSSMIHSIDLHAVTGPGGGAAVTQVGAGQESTIRFRALSPGVFVYHCATPLAPAHIANGMYGLIIVEPPDGLAPVDREFYVMQGELYLQGERGQAGLQEFSGQKMLAEQPDYVVFNGSVGSLAGDRSLHAQVGDTVRIFFGVGGPNLPSSFHVIGEIFDRVYPDLAGAPLTNIQTTLVPPGGATMVEFTLQEPGDYALVDHSLSRVVKGALGTLHVEGADDPSIYYPPAPPGGGGH